MAIPVTSPSYYGNYSDKDQPTLNTVADYLDDARTLLQDRLSPYRYDDPSLLIALNVALLETRRQRSELFVFNLRVNGQVQSFSVVDDTYVDMEPQFRVGLLYRMCGHALVRDQEDVQDIRATAFFNLANGVFVGRGLGVMAGGSGPDRGQQQGPGG
jgi:hypothetical protein